MAGKRTKTKRAKPVDRRKLPHVRATMETAAKHKLDPQQSLALSVLCQCNGDWNDVADYFKTPKILMQGGWPTVQVFMELHRPFFDQLYQEVCELIRQYSTLASEAIQ